MKRIVGHQAAPHKIPQRVQRFTRIASARSIMNLRKEGRASSTKPLKNCRLAL